MYNLFSNFGNIEKIIFIKNKNFALIQFQSQVFAKMAKEYLNNVNFFGKHLRITHSKY